MSDPIDEAIDAVNNLLGKLKKVTTLHQEISVIVDDLDFDLKMAVLSMCISKAIINEADNSNEAMSYVARLSHSLVTVIDKLIEEAQKKEEDEDKDEPVH